MSTYPPGLLKGNLQTVTQLHYGCGMAGSNKQNVTAVVM